MRSPWATMSAGKSTVLNALLGDDLLYSANEATTSAITKLHINKPSIFGAVSYCANKFPISEEVIVNNETLKEWNKDKNVHFIDVFMNNTIQSKSKKRLNLVYIDTPGPNNSQDSSHHELLDNALDNNKINVILYILNCSQLATNDDFKLLSRLYKYIHHNQDTQVVFIINKADVIDEESGESLKNIVNNTKLYLEMSGFKNPVIVPLMARMSLVAKKIITGNNISRKENNMLKNELERFRLNKHYLNDHSLINSNEKDKTSKQLNRIIPLFLHKVFCLSQTKNGMNKSELKQFCSYTGIQTIEDILSK
jgi:hypothetical protein